MILIPFALLCSIIIGYLIGASKGRGAECGLLAFLLGPLGWIIGMFLPAKALADDRPTCPACGGKIQTSVSICPHCRTALRLQPSLSVQKPGILIYRGDETYGPFNLQQIAEGLKNGTISIEDEAVDNQTFEPINLADRFPHKLA